MIEKYLMFQNYSSLSFTIFMHCLNFSYGFAHLMNLIIF